MGGGIRLAGVNADPDEQVTVIVRAVTRGGWACDGVCAEYWGGALGVVRTVCEMWMGR